jgi:hypothetical protein
MGIMRRKAFLAEQKIDMIVVSSFRLEREVLWLQSVPFVRPVASEGPLTVYRVELEV